MDTYEQWGRSKININYNQEQIHTPSMFCWLFFKKERCLTMKNLTLQIPYKMDILDPCEIDKNS